MESPAEISAACLAERCADRLGHRFSRPELLLRALTHPSVTAETQKPGTPRSKAHKGNYERLEFLGDRVLGLVVADILFHTFPKEAEGPLARRFAGVVCRDALAEVARQLDLGSLLRLAKAEEEAGERENPALLSNACEAVIAALYLDGGLDAARGFIERYWPPLIAAERKPPRDAKTGLQEWAQGRGLPLPNYQELDRQGPDHSPTFTIRVSVAGQGSQEGRGASKRAAEQAAAERLLAKLGE